MVHIITAQNRHLYESELLEHHRVRRNIYIEERKWEGLLERDGGEYDQFDTHDMTYVLAIENGRVVGGSRLYPTLKRHMLEEVCPQLADIKGVPRGHDILEWTRIFVIKERREGRYGGGVLGKIFCGLIEFCLDEDIDQLSFVFEAWWLPRLQELGWVVKPLGLPGLIANEWWLAATVDIDNRMYAQTRAFFRVDGPVTVRNGLPSRVIHQVA